MFPTFSSELPECRINGPFQNIQTFLFRKGFVSTFLSVSVSYLMAISGWGFWIVKWISNTPLFFIVKVRLFLQPWTSGPKLMSREGVMLYLKKAHIAMMSGWILRTACDQNNTDAVSRPHLEKTDVMEILTGRLVMSSSSMVGSIT